MAWKREPVTPAWQSPIPLTSLSIMSRIRPDRGTYYTIQGETGLYLEGNRPVLPLTTRNLDSSTNAVRGVMYLGGTFTELTNYDPVIQALIFENSDEITGEGRYDFPHWYPVTLASLNRFIRLGTRQ
jgi:hypothetical protein